MEALMSHVSLLLAVAALWGLAVVSPGPNFLVTARLTLARSRRAGLEAVCGIAIGTLCWAAAGCFGVHALFLAAPWMYVILKIGGAAYLLIMGLRLLLSSYARQDDVLVPIAVTRQRLSPFQLGLLTTLANPRSALSVASIFATTVPSHPSLALSFTVMGLMTMISISWYTAVALLFAMPYFAKGYQQLRRWIDRASGAFLMFFGAKLAVEP